MPVLQRSTSALTGCLQVLKAILFNMRVEHPYQDLIKTVKAVRHKPQRSQPTQIIQWKSV